MAQAFALPLFSLELSTTCDVKAALIFAISAGVGATGATTNPATPGRGGQPARTIDSTQNRLTNTTTTTVLIEAILRGLDMAWWSGRDGVSGVRLRAGVYAVCVGGSQ